MTEITVRKIAVLAACLLPALAFADAPPAVGAPPAVAPPAAAPAAPAAPATPITAPAQAAPQPTWSFGGGVGFTLLSLVTQSSSLLSGGAQAASVPTVAASLERRVSPRDWLVVGVAGAATRNRQDVPEGSVGWSRDDLRFVTVSAGLRHWLTRRAAPVGVSLAVLAEGGVVDQEYQLENRFSVTTPSITRYDATSWFAGAQLGLAVERELTEGLSVRVTSPLVQARYGEGSVRSAGRPDVKSSGATAGVFLAPQLELRLLF